MNTGLSEDNRKNVADRLQVLLADEFLLYTKLRNYHWNIKAPNFTELHEFYEGQYDEIALMIDELAEHIRSLGFISKGRVQDFLELTRLEEQDYTTKAEEQLANLIQDHESIIRYLRDCANDFEEKYDDAVSGDLAIEFMDKHGKMRWMLDSYLP